MAEITEFDKAKARYHKRNDSYVKLEDRPKPQKSIPKSSVAITITDNDVEYKFVFNTPYLPSTRIGSKRNRQAYQEVLSDFVKKEFGKWQLLRTP